MCIRNSRNPYRAVYKENHDFFLRGKWHKSCTHSGNIFLHLKRKPPERTTTMTNDMRGSIPPLKRLKWSVERNIATELFTHDQDEKIAFYAFSCHGEKVLKTVHIHLTCLVISVETIDFYGFLFVPTHLAGFFWKLGWHTAVRICTMKTGRF